LPSIDSTQLSHLIDRIYEAGMAPGTWPSVLKGLAGALNAKSGLLRTLDLQGQRTVLASHHHNLDPSLQTDYCAHFVGQDPYLERLKRFPPGRMVTNDQLIDLNRFRRSAFYRHYLRPLDNHFIVGGYLERRDGQYTIFGLHRHHRDRPFARDELATVQLLAPHLRRTVQLQRRLASETRRANAAEQALEAMGVAAFLLDRHGHLVHSNSLGERLLQAPQGVFTRYGGPLRPRDPAQAKSFCGMVDRVRHATEDEGLPGTESLLLGTPDTGLPRLLATAYPVPAHRCHFREAWPEVRVAVYVGDLEDTGLLRPETLTSLYGLTPAESRLAVALARGRELAELAAEWSVSRETLRTHLKRILGKTGTSRQAELIRLLAGAPWKLTAFPHTQETAQ